MHMKPITRAQVTVSWFLWSSCGSKTVQTNHIRPSFSRSGSISLFNLKVNFHGQSYSACDHRHIEITKVNIEITTVHIEITTVHIEIITVHIEITTVHIEITTVHIEITTANIEITTLYI